MRAESGSPRAILPPLAGALLLLMLGLRHLPHPRAMLRAPATPFEHGPPRFFAHGFALVTRAATVVPPGASVAARVEPPDPSIDTYLHRLAVALLPGRRVLPAALWGTPTPDGPRQADYLIVMGGKLETSPGTLLLQVPEGTVWRRTD